MKKTMVFAALLFIAAFANAQKVTQADTLKASGRITLRGVKVDSISVFIPSSGATNNEVATDKAVADYVTAHSGGSGATVSFQEFSPTSGSVVTLTGTIPSDQNFYLIYRNGVNQNVGSGKGVTSINTTTKVITFSRAFVSGELVRVRIQQ